jgi:hypothetical protein
MSTRRWGALAGAGLVAAIVVVLLVVVLGRRSQTGGSATRGVVFVDGQQLQAPFTVTTQGTAVLVNGKVAADFGVPKVDDVRPTPAAGDNAFTVVSEVRRAYLDAGGGDKGVAAALAMLRSHPAAPKFSELQNPHAIEVTDASGETGTFRIDVPDAAARPTDDG